MALLQPDRTDQVEQPVPEPLPGQARRSLWLFCDTLVTGRHGQVLGYPILGAGTAAEGPYVAGRGPGALTELATPGTDPAARS